MFMRSIIQTAHNLKHHWKMKALLFSSVSMCLFLPQRTEQGYPEQMLMMCCLLQRSGINQGVSYSL